MSNVMEQLAELTGFRDRDLIDATLVTALRELLQPRLVAIYRIVGRADDLRWLTRARQAADDAVPSADPGWVDLEGLPRLDDHPARRQAMDEQQMVQQAGTPSRTVYPLMSELGPIGVLEIESAQPLDLAAHRQLGSILRVYRNFQSLLDYSERDTLTGLLNRKTYEESFYRLAARTLAGLDEDDAPQGDRRSASGSLQQYVGVIDIDHFKSVNDRFGHLIGDEVLLLLSRLMRSCFRHDDHLYRFGGEEFVVLMRCRVDDDAMGAFERFRLLVRGYAFPQVGQITVSVGFSRVGGGRLAGHRVRPGRQGRVLGQVPRPRPGVQPRGPGG